MWLSASTTITGASLQGDLIIVSPSGAKTTLGTVVVTGQDIALVPAQYTLNITSLSSGTVGTGYILGFQVTMDVSGGSTRTAALSFDSFPASSRAVLTLTDHINVVSLQYYNSSLVPAFFFSKNWSAGDRQVVAISTVTDALGLYDVSQVTLTARNPSGSLFVNGSTMTKLTGLDTSYSGLWQATFPYGPGDPSGVYNGTASVRDFSGNVRTSVEFAFRIFALWPLEVSVSTSPLTSDPLGNVIIRALDGPSLVWSAGTNAQGTAQGLLRDDRQYEVEAVWESSIVGRQSNLTITGPYNLNMLLQVRLFQLSGLFSDGDGRPLDTSPFAITLTAPNGSIINPDPDANYYLQDGDFTVNAVIWKGINVVPSGSSFNPAVPSTVRLNIYDLSVIATDTSGRALQNANVTVIYSGSTVASGLTDSSGLVYLRQLPAEEYALIVRHSQGQATKSIILDKTQTVSVQVAPLVPPSPIDLYLFGLTVGAGIIMLLGAFIGYRRLAGLKFRERGFEYLDRITGGGIPRASSILITGDPGSGKTLLAEQLAIDWLRRGRTCVYVSYSSLPNDIRARMRPLGLDSGNNEISVRLAIIDCYSAQAKLGSSERFAMERPFDLTTLGIQLGQALNETGEKDPLVIIDPLSPLFNKISPIVVVNFLQDKTAKIKGLGGTTVFTLGNGTVPKEILGSLLALADGILELTASTSKDGIVRSLQVRKMKNQSFKDSRFDFRIRPSRGIRFLTRRGLFE